VTAFGLAERGLELRVQRAHRARERVLGQLGVLARRDERVLRVGDRREHRLGRDLLDADLVPLEQALDGA
jgi:hypothetical protein